MKKNSKAKAALRFLWGCSFLVWVFGVQAHPEPAPPAGDLNRLIQAGPVIRELVERYGYLFGPVDQQTLRSSAQELIGAGWYRQTNDVALEDLSISVCQLALARVERVLESAPLERISAGPTGTIRTTRRIRREWPSGRGTLLFRITSPSAAADITPVFIQASIDLRRGNASPHRVQVPAARTVYAIIYAAHAAHGAAPVELEFTRQEESLAKVELAAQAPPTGELEMVVREETSGQPTPVVIGLYAADHQLIVPPEAISLDFWQNGGPPVTTRPYQTCRYWPGSNWEREVCFVNGGFKVSLPEGEYRLIVGKGPEYEPVLQTCRVNAGKTSSARIALRRWVNMPARGWVSGDGHVHFSRRSPQANPPLMTWIQAENVHVANVLRMGDANSTYFEQYAFGPAGRIVEGAYSLIPGQEDPRTDDLGHVLAMNLKAPVRWPAQYHLYDVFFDEVHVQGGLAGYAHVYQPPRPAFWVRRDMTLNIPKGKIDFVEVAEFGEAGDQLYNEFLNLGFRLTATAGSDVPWGDSVGVSRTYAYTGGSTDPDAWFRAVQQGHTFVTAGPMLMLKVNGQIPGTEINAQAGDTLQIEASAEGWAAKPRFLEVVAQGEIIGTAKPVSSDERKYWVELALPVKQSTWITARCAGALTSPVYVRVGNEPWWKREAVPQLVDIRLNQLREIEAFARQVEQGLTAGYADPERLRKQIPALRERVAAARELYRQLRKQSQRAPGKR